MLEAINFVECKLQQECCKIMKSILSDLCCVNYCTVHILLRCLEFQSDYTHGCRQRGARGAAPHLDFHTWYR